MDKRCLCRMPRPAGSRQGRQWPPLPLGSRNLEPRPEGIGAIDPDGVEAGRHRRPLDRRDDRRLIAQHHLFFHPPDEAAANIASPASAMNPFASFVFIALDYTTKVDNRVLANTQYCYT